MIVYKWLSIIDISGIYTDSKQLGVIFKGLLYRMNAHNDHQTRLTAHKYSTTYSWVLQLSPIGCFQATSWWAAWTLNDRLSKSGQSRKSID